MHAAYLGLLQNHVQNVWGISVSVKDRDTSIHASKVIPRPEPEIMGNLYKIIKVFPKNLHQTLTRAFRHPALWHVCVEQNLRHARTIRQLVDAIVEWVRFICLLILSLTDGL